MSNQQSYEEQLLEPMERFLNEASEVANQFSFEFRLQLLETAASLIAGFPIQEFNEKFQITQLCSSDQMSTLANHLVARLNCIPLHPAMALSALAREPLDMLDQRTSGAYNTDFRLAKHVAGLGASILKRGCRVIDPACGTGSLLVAVSLEACERYGVETAEWLTNSVYAADLSPTALRGARLALASLTHDIGAIDRMWANWKAQDSLVASSEVWSSMCPQGFDLVVGNPPWEKIKLTRHEYLSSEGDNRHYGDDYGVIDGMSYAQKKQGAADYAGLLREAYGLLGQGEPDLYMAFVQLFLQLVKPGGLASILVPAGLIRSQGTERLRRHLLAEAQDLLFTVMENRARFFSIDTRFKFLAVSFTRADRNKNHASDPIRLSHGIGTAAGISCLGLTSIDRETLQRIRPDLTIPEVRSSREWHIFSRMQSNGHDWSQSQSAWYPQIVREVDMTRDRPKFTRRPGPGAVLPVVEGRMVQAHRFGAKVYVSGTGRRAIWSPRPIGKSTVVPQFWITAKDLNDKARERTRGQRIGFCDIAGQTNERSLMAALIPPGVVCGNKVPTITFPNDPSEERLLLWIGIANSLPFDWMLRRVLTTTVNYFLLLSLPLPQIEPDDLTGRHISLATRQLHEMDRGNAPSDLWRMASLRATIDVSVLVTYGLQYEDLVTMLDDFPLLDRGQPPIPGEPKSTITRDYLLYRAAQRFGMPTDSLHSRVKAARLIGAFPYVPSEMTSAVADEKEVAVK